MFRDIIFLIIINSKVLDRFDVSHEFWEQFGVKQENTRKQLSLYEIEHIDDPCFLTIAANSKEYIEYFESEYINKKHKGIKKSKNSMNLQSFGKRINSLREIEQYEDREKNETAIEQSRFTVQKNEKVLETVQKKKFSQLNDKRYYFQCGIVSLPLAHLHLRKINEHKWSQKQRIKNWF